MIRDWSLEEAARSDEDRGRRPRASYFVASDKEDDQPIRSSGSAFSLPTTTNSSGTSVLAYPGSTKGRTTSMLVEERAQG
jgi:hypothetical protein